MTPPPPPRAPVQPDIGDEARDLADSERAHELHALRAERDALAARLADATEAVQTQNGVVLSAIKARLKAEQSLADAQATVERLRDALEYGLRCLASHQVYDKDMRGVFERALAARPAAAEEGEANA